MKAADNHYWIKNITGSDLLFSELDVKIESMTEVDLLRKNPSLTLVKIVNSAKSGSLKKGFDLKKIIKLAKPTVVTNIATYTNKISESLKPIPSRSKTSVVINPNEHDYIEELSEDFKKSDELKFVDYAEGFADPSMDYEDVVISNIEGENSDNSYKSSDDKYQPISKILNKK